MPIGNKITDKAFFESIFPRRIEIEIASACNLKCSYCPRRYMGNLNGFIDFLLFKKLIDEISKFPETVLVLHRRGESLLHPDFIEMCRYVEGKFKEVQLATNATLLDEKKTEAIIKTINFISFSIDAPETFNKTRIPADYADVEKNIFYFLRRNKGMVKTQVSMVKTKETLSKNIGAFKEKWHGEIDRIRIYEEHSRNGAFGSLARDRGLRSSCVMPFYEMLILCDGKVGRCNHDWNGAPLGDVTGSRIKDIWHNPSYENLRKQQRSLLVTDSVCRVCDCWYPEIGKQATGETVE